MFSSIFCICSTEIRPHNFISLQQIAKSVNHNVDKDFPIIGLKYWSAKQTRAKMDYLRNTTENVLITVLLVSKDTCNVFLWFPLVEPWILRSCLAHVENACTVCQESSLLLILDSFSMSLKFQLTSMDTDLSVVLLLEEEIGRIQDNALKYPKSIKVTNNSAVGSTWKYPINRQMVL